MGGEGEGRGAGGPATLTCAGPRPSLRSGGARCPRRNGVRTLRFARSSEQLRNKSPSPNSAPTSFICSVVLSGRRILGSEDRGHSQARRSARGRRRRFGACWGRRCCLSARDQWTGTPRVEDASGQRAGPQVLSGLGRVQRGPRRCHSPPRKQPPTREQAAAARPADRVSWSPAASARKLP